MDKYCYIDENGDKVDYYTLVKDNGELCEEIKRLNNQLKKKDEVIEKAIEYIKETSIGSILEVHCGCEEDYIEPLLSILEDKEV